MIFGLVDLGPAIGSRLPLHSPVLGGVALGLIVGVPMAATALHTARRAATRAVYREQVCVLLGAADFVLGWAGGDDGDIVMAERADGEFRSR